MPTRSQVTSVSSECLALSQKVNFIMEIRDGCDEDSGREMEREVCVRTGGLVRILYYRMERRWRGLEC